jgi:hypothetical protein
LPLITAKIKEAGIWGIGGVGIAMGLLYWLIKKDLKDFRENGDPLLIQKILARIPGQRADTIVDNLAESYKARRAGEDVGLASLLASIKNDLAELKAAKPA